MEADHHGEVVAIDVDSGSWAMGEEVLQAVERLRAQHPGAINILSERGGYRALVSFVRYLARLHLRIGVQDYRPPSQISKMVLSIVNIGSPAKD